VHFSQRQRNRTLYENLSCGREHNAHQNNHDAPKYGGQDGFCPFVCFGLVRAEDLRLAIGR